MGRPALNAINETSGSVAPTALENPDNEQLCFALAHLKIPSYSAPWQSIHSGNH
jgi:hypothetical protein